MATLLDRANRLPPCLCRLLARKSNGRRAMSHSEIATLADMPVSTIADLSMKQDWNGVPIDVVEKFSAACGVNILSAERQLEFARRCLDPKTPPHQRRKMSYIDVAPRPQRLLLLRLFVLCQRRLFLPQADNRGALA